MYTIDVLAKFLKKVIDDERKLSYQSICVVFGGILLGTLIGYLSYSQVDFLNIMVKLSGLGISLSTIIGVVYYLYKYDEIETRKSAFLEHIDKEINNSKLTHTYVNPQKLNDIIFGMLKDKLTEKSQETKTKKDEE